MLKVMLAGLALVLAVPAAAADTIDLPPHSFVYEGDSRGYWFTAPVDFVMRGVLVPTEAGTGAQSVAVMRLANVPPQFPSTTNDFTTLHLSQNVAGTAEIPLALQFFAGDVVGLLGVRAGSFGDNNSYANESTYVTDLGGNAVTLSRLGMQYQLTTTSPRDLFAENNGNISRVFFSYDLGRLSPAVPEPGTWAMMILGFGVVGAAMRRRSATVRTSVSYA